MFPKEVRAIFALTQTLTLVLLVSLTLPGSVYADKAPPSVTVIDSLSGESIVDEGKVIYVDFWASWCIPCRASFPWMASLLEKYGDKGLQIIAINVDKDRAAAEKFLKANKSSPPVVYDPKGKMAKLWDLQTMPTSFLYGRDGKLKSRREGFVPEETEPVEALIRQLLEEKPKE